MAMKALPILLAALCVFAGGCASSSKSGKPDPKTVNWSERIGAYTYEQAVADMGKPAVISESNEGRSAEWVLRRGSRMSFGFGVGTGSYGSHGGLGVGVGSSVSPPPSGEYLHLHFGSDGQLREWSKIRH
jgi:hypothetical protein